MQAISSHLCFFPCFQLIYSIPSRSRRPAKRPAILRLVFTPATGCCNRAVSIQISVRFRSPVLNLHTKKAVETARPPHSLPSN